VPPKSANVGGQNPEFILREFQGMNTVDAREAINDNEFAWCENAIPVGNGTLYPVPASTPFPLITGETTDPTYTMAFFFGTNNCEFVVFAATGNGYLVTLGPAPAVTLIITGLTSGQTYATQYGNSGLLIIDPTGYWDYGLTTGGLTPQNNAAASATLSGTAKTVAGGTPLQLVVSAGGTGATFQALYQVVTATLVDAGTGYAVGDTINLSDGSPSTPAQIIVASISGGGATGPITGITLASGGSYPGPDSATLVATGPTGTVVTTTGAGTGATFTDHIQAVSLNILTRGTGYTGTTTVTDFSNTGATIDVWDITSSGVIGGTGIATYAGRVWIALNRTVYFTDINSYNSFGGVGGSFTINDSYLHNAITCIFAANNYLYIFGDTSIDALSNVTVSGGVTSFSRINVTGSVGTTFPASVYAYYRAIVFYNTSGIYLLAGATPEKISEKISGIVSKVIGGANTVYGFSAQIRGELCAGMQFLITDTFTQGGTVRPLMVLFFRGKWWVCSYTNPGFSVQTTAIASISNNGVITAYGWYATSSGVEQYTLFGSDSLASWLLKTKLWDGGAPTTDKQSLNAAVAGQWTGVSPSGVSINIDTEINSLPAVVSPLPVQSDGYHFNVSAVNNGGTQYLGLTVSGSTGMSQIDMLALRGTSGPRNKMQ
jgi:hypothetical protein